MLRFSVVCLIAVLGVAVAAAENRASDPGAIECAHPPTGVIRVTLLSDQNAAELYEWSGTSFRLTGTVPLDETFDRQFKEGTFYVWNHWGSNVPAISRNAASSDSILSSPYSISMDGRWFAAGVQRQNERNHPPSRLAFIELGASLPVRIVEIGESIKAVSWNPSGLELVVLSEVERYGTKTLRERFAAAIGHPIPYSDIKLSIVGLDGSIRCSISAARALPYGNGRVSWDAE